MRIPAIDRKVLRWFVHRLRPYRARLFLVALLTLVQSALSLPTLLLIRRVFDEVVPQRDEHRLLVIGAAIIGLRILGSGLAIAMRAVVLAVSKEVVQTLRDQVARHIMTRSQTFLSSADLAQLHTRIIQDAERTDTSLTAIVAGVLPALLSAAVLAGVLLFISPWLALIGAATVPLLWLVGRLTTRAVAAHLTMFRSDFEQVGARTQFLLRFAELVRQRGAVDSELRVQEQAHAALRASGIRMGMSFTVHANLQRIVTGILGIGLLVAGGMAVMRGSITLGDFLVFYVAAGMLSGFLDTIGSAMTELISGTAALGTLKDILGSGAAEPYGGTEPIAFQGTIALHDVRFSYDARPLLRGVSLDITPGDLVLISGPNGIGKSTLSQLILGTIRPSEGTVTADGILYERIDMAMLRQRIGVVPQHTLCFRGTILDNLTYGLVAYSPQALARALDMSSLDDVISQLPRGLQTVIGDQGTMLSGGQAQRLSIARALLAEPALLIFDEPTTHLDADTVTRLFARLASWADRPAMLIISHDLATLPFVDRAYRIDNGRLRLDDTHEPASR